MDACNRFDDRQDKTRQDKTRQDKTRQDKTTRQDDKTNQGETRQVYSSRQNYTEAKEPTERVAKAEAKTTTTTRIWLDTMNPNKKKWGETKMMDLPLRTALLYEAECLIWVRVWVWVWVRVWVWVWVWGLG